VAWERRGDGLYYYQSERENGRVRKRYVGRGEVAEMVAHADKTIRQSRKAKAQREREELERARGIALAGVDLDAAAEVLARAEMVAAGWHNHKGGEWRRRRGC
jgi:hypothetical protein